MCPRQCQKPHLFTLNTLLIPELFFLKPNRWPKWCTVLGPIIMQNIKKIYSGVSEKMSKNPNFWTLNPLLIPGIKNFFSILLANFEILSFWIIQQKLDKSLRVVIELSCWWTNRPNDQPTERLITVAISYDPANRSMAQNLTHDI